MNSRAYINALGNMLFNGIDETPMAQAFEQGEIPDTAGARFLAGIPCALVLSAHYLAYALGTFTFAIVLGSIPLRLPGNDSDTNPLVSKRAFINMVKDSLEHLGLERDGFWNDLLSEAVFPMINLAAITVGFAFIGWAGLIAFLPATLTFAAQATNNIITLYNTFAPMVSSFPEITIMGIAIAVGGLIMKGLDWAADRMEVSRKNKEAERSALTPDLHKPGKVQYVPPKLVENPQPGEAEPHPPENLQNAPTRNSHAPR